MIHILKQFFGRNEYEDSENLIRVAFAEGKLNKSDIDLINSEIDGVDISESDLRIDRNHANRIKLALPNRNSQKFRIMYLLIRKFNQRNGLDDARRRLLTELFSVIHHERSRIDELIDAVISNVTMGNSEGETFRRLGYLLKPRQVSFN